MKVSIGKVHVIVASAAVLGAGLGSLSSLLLFRAKVAAATKAEVTEKLEAIYADQTEEMRLHYAKLYKRDEFSAPMAVIADGMLTILKEEEYDNPDNFPEPSVVSDGQGGILATVPGKVDYTKPGGEEVTNVNVFDLDESDGDAWDLQRELDSRDDLFPYIISDEEFLENELEHAQSRIFYYDEDAVVAYESDVIMTDAEEVLDLDNLKFGYGSSDRNVVYIRNVRIEMDFQVLRVSGSYSKTVAGFDEDDVLEHSHKPRKFRGYDE